MKIDFRAAVEGTVIVAALLAAESANQETYAETVIAVALAIILYMLAHTYARFAGERLRDEEPLSFAGLVRAASHEAWIFPGSGIPLLTVLLCWALGASLSTALTAAVWTSAGMIVVYELAGGIRASETGRDLAVETAVGALLGALVIVLRIVLH